MCVGECASEWVSVREGLFLLLASKQEMDESIGHVSRENEDVRGYKEVGSQSPMALKMPIIMKDEW